MEWREPAFQSSNPCRPAVDVKRNRARLVGTSTAEPNAQPQSRVSPSVTVPCRSLRAQRRQIATIAGPHESFKVCEIAMRNRNVDKASCCQRLDGAGWHRRNRCETERG